MRCFDFDLAAEVKRNFAKIQRRCERPSRPSMPINGMKFREWYASYSEELKEWFKSCYGRDVATREEWAAYVTDQFVAEQELGG